MFCLQNPTVSSKPSTATEERKLSAPCVIAATTAGTTATDGATTNFNKRVLVRKPDLKLVDKDVQADSGPHVLLQTAASKRSAGGFGTSTPSPHKKAHTGAAPKMGGSCVEASSCGLPFPPPLPPRGNLRLNPAVMRRASPKPKIASANNVNSKTISTNNVLRQSSEAPVLQVWPLTQFFSVSFL